jgi:hypothetical protein
MALAGGAISGHLDGRLLTDLSAVHIPQCTHVRDTGLFLCASDSRANDALVGIPTERVPSLLAFARFESDGRHVIVDPSGVVTIAAGSAPGIALATRPLAAGAAGSYDVAWDFLVADTSSPETEIARVDVLLDGVVVRQASLLIGDSNRTSVVVGFAATAGQRFEARLWHAGIATLAIEGAQLLSSPTN